MFKDFIQNACFVHQFASRFRDDNSQSISVLDWGFAEHNASAEVFDDTLGHTDLIDDNLKIQNIQIHFNSMVFSVFFALQFFI